MKINGRVNEEKVFSTAKKIGLDIDQLKKDINSPEIEQQLVKNREIVNPAVTTRDVLIALFGLINIIKIISKYNRICFFDIKN